MVMIYKGRSRVVLAGTLAWFVSAMGHGTLASELTAQKPLDAKQIAQFIDDLPDFSALGRVDGSRPYTVRFEEFQQKILPASFYANLPAPFSAGTLLFGYGIDQEVGESKKHFPQLPLKGLFPGYTVEVTRGQTAFAEYQNHLYPAPNAQQWFKNPIGPSLQRYLTSDQSIHWANPRSAPMMVGHSGNPKAFLGPQPTVTHLHGAEVPAAFDGGPDQWWTPGAEGDRAVPPPRGSFRGPNFVSNLYQYPNTQEPTT